MSSTWARRTSSVSDTSTLYDDPLPSHRRASSSAQSWGGATAGRHGGKRDRSTSPKPDSLPLPLSPATLRRRFNLPYLTVTLVVVFSLLLYLHPPTALSTLPKTFAAYHALLRPAPPSTFPPPSISLPRTLVGPRTFPPSQFLSPSCPTIDHYLASIASARIADDGASLKVDWDEPETDELPMPFEFSFDLAGGCNQPMWYEPEKACDILQAFGGVFMRGDSYVRHVWETLLMLVTNSTDGAISDPKHYGDCRGEHMYNDGKVCRRAFIETIPGQISPCGGLLNGEYRQQELADEYDMGPYLAWNARRSVTHQQRSPIFYQSDGVHFGFSLQNASSYFLPVMRLRDRTYPAPLSIWAGLHAPGENIRDDFRESQGRDKVKLYNHVIKANIEARTSDLRFEDGGMRMVEFYEMTEGAESFDGQHYSYQVNMEKVQLLLNILDMTWTDIVSRGGLVDLQPDVPMYEEEDAKQGKV